MERATFLDPGGSTISRDDQGLRIDWQAGGCRVEETLACAVDQAVLFRRVTVRNHGTSAVEVTVIHPFAPNQFYFDEFSAERDHGLLAAGGYHRLELRALSPARVAPREIEVAIGPLASGAAASAGFVLSVDEPAPVSVAAPSREPAAVSFDAGDARLNRLFHAARTGIRAAVSRSRKMDGGMLQYNAEWIRDSVMVASGAVLAGLPSVSEAILRRAFQRFVDSEGRTAETGRIHPDETIELDQNGELLHALWTHWCWTGSDELIREYWTQVRSVADFVLRPVFRDPDSGLVKNTREFWERGPTHGVLPGYELAYQLWNIAGLSAAAGMAAHLGHADGETRWRDASARMKESLVHHPRLSLVEEGRFIKRRLATGSPQRTMNPPDRGAIADSMPLHYEKVPLSDPDATMALPFALGLADAGGELARNTLAALETLWNQRWDVGGYGRYHVTSEPDSPGPWPFASLFIARAYLEAGDSDKVWRVLDWLLHVPGGNSGAWFEFYGERPSPPLLSVGIIPWIWAEIVTLLVHHLLGVRPSPSGLLIRPRLLDGLDRITTRLPVNGAVLHLEIERTSGQPEAEVDGKPFAVPPAGLSLAKPRGDLRVRLRVPGNSQKVPPR